jgi:hypothetical protein
VSEPGCGDSEMEGGRSRSNEGPFCSGGSSPEHDYVIGSRSRDRTPSTREPRAFHLSSDKSLLDPNRSPFNVQNVQHVRAQQVSLTIVSAPDPNMPPYDVPTTCAQ